LPEELVPFIESKGTCVLRYGVAVHKIDVVDVVRFGEASTDLSDQGASIRYGRYGFATLTVAS
jgi:hypothetical protein